MPSSAKKNQERAKLVYRDVRAIRMELADFTEFYPQPKAARDEKAGAPARSTFADRLWIEARYSAGSTWGTGMSAERKSAWCLMQNAATAGDYA